MPDTTKQLAKAVLSMAAAGGMPDTYWQTDRRIKMACAILEWTPDKARKWAEKNVRYHP